jgi:SAM-dependent methyltransferase
MTAMMYDLRARLRYLRDGRTRRRNAEFLAAGDWDGLPLPPPELVYLVAGHFDLREYYETGVAHSAFLRERLASNGVDPASLGSLLDFGCGCARVLRHWHGLPSVRLHGSDLNPRLVSWCRAALPFAEFSRNSLAPTLPFADGSFDFVYAISVFTHLPEQLQRPWLRELERVLAPGALLLVTTKGGSRLDSLNADERRRFEEGELIIQYGEFPGKNLCAAYHPYAYVKNVLAEGLEIVEFVPAVRGREPNQDTFLLRK